MPVMPNDFHFLDYAHGFKELIFQGKSTENQGQNIQNITSISHIIDPIDPLIFLSIMKQHNQLSFYWENQKKQEAIVAIGAIKSLQVNDNQTENNRFEQCQHFVKNTLNDINYIDESLNINYPHFFSYFTFLDKHNHYNKSFSLATIFIPYIQLFKKKDIYTLTINTYNNYPNLEKIKEQIKNNFSEKIILHQSLKTEKENLLSYSLEESQYQPFIDKVNHGLEAIKTKKLTKIVVAHALEVKTNTNFNIIKSLKNLRKNYPDCYIFAIGNEQEENFIGASPERLLSIQDNQLISDALAGSASRGKNNDEDQKIGKNLLNSEKEKREHQVVSNFIFKQLSNMGLNPQKASLQLLKLSNIQHLWTPINAEINPNITPFEIIHKLHPTPAVAGEPINLACNLIEKSENFDRSLYAAPIGWLDKQGNCEFIVGIRSALIKENSARLYAGAGIVAGSKPEQELTEIKLKFQALLQALI
ncbi:isochorismate synthase [Geminocystis sp. GBBB08]|uniref:isochorismate synthase n=1 Tax=Geminocystis sp. GBBB08 TaxID=2604140 RepID=UPI0027E284EC|nr:isochorismate synthase [Geminocystis sp. GBBB08]MBL1209030.1 isochorismate synthase [Geminocystis sp. GBBB08]